MEKLLNSEFILDNPIFKFMQVHENKEDQAVSLAKESKLVLSLIHIKSTKEKNDKKMPSFPAVVITFKI